MIPRFALEAKVVALGRAINKFDGVMQEGWIVHFQFPTGPLVKLFLSLEELETERKVATRDGNQTLTIRNRPALKPGDVVEFAVRIPVLDDI